MFTLKNINNTLYYTILMSLQDIVKETERQLKRIYSLKKRKYLASIYLSIGLYFPIVLILTGFHISSFILNLVGDVTFLSIVAFCIYIEIKLSEAEFILRKLEKITNKKLPKYSLYITWGKYSFDVIGTTLLVIIIITLLLTIPYLPYILAFIFLEYYFSHVFLYDRIPVNFEDWIAIISATCLPLIYLDSLSSIIFSVSWITAGIVSLVRAYG